MASKKKGKPPRPRSGSRPGTKQSGQRAAASKPAGAAKTAAGDKTGAGAAAGQAGTAERATSGVASRPAREKTGPTRAERLAAAETARRRRAARNRALVIGAIVAVLTLITVTVVNSRRSENRIESALEAGGACEYDTRSDSDSGTGRNHLSGDLRYEVDPPAGGNHNPSPSPPGIFTMESKPPDAGIVHSLEHGYVAIWHRPDLDPAALEELRGLAGRYDRDVLLVPRASLSQPVAATAWHRRVLCSRPDVAVLERFITEFRNEGPEKVPH